MVPSTEDARISADARVSAPPKLVLLPGLDGTGTLFAPLIAPLSGRVSTIVVSYPDRVLNYSEHERLVRAALPTGGPFVLLGESFSGPIAVSIAAEAPPGLVGCIVCASFVVCPRRILAFARPCLGSSFANMIPMPLARHLLMGRFATPELCAMHLRAMRCVSPGTLAARLKEIAAVDVSRSLTRIRVPTLYIRGTEDRLVPKSASRLFSRLNSTARVVEVEAPHFLLQVRAKEVARTIEAFIEHLA